MLHVTLLVPGSKDTLLWQANTLLDPLRMPLFFLVSGLFSSKVLNFSLGELFRRRLWFFIIPYLIWVPIEVTVTNEMRQLAGISQPFTLMEHLGLIATGRNMAWFLYALVLFNLALWLTKKLPWWGTVLVALSPILLIQLHHDVPIVAKAIMYLPIFLAGTYLRHPIKRFATTALTPTRLMFALAGYLSAVAFVIAWNNFIGENYSVTVPVPLIGDLDHSALQLLVNQLHYMLMLPAGVVLAVALAQVPGLSRGLQFLGRNTLPIYLGHPIMLTLLISFPREIYDSPSEWRGPGSGCPPTCGSSSALSRVLSAGWACGCSARSLDYAGPCIRRSFRNRRRHVRQYRLLSQSPTATVTRHSGHKQKGINDEWAAPLSSRSSSQLLFSWRISSRRDLGCRIRSLAPSFASPSRWCCSFRRNVRTLTRQIK
ncbi:acyltransferase family protein [Corynebacterium pilosum]|uniref:Hypothetical membrane protein n=1 Tax=Corynebacterium pilosum TaxID=35756 RepID=A0A376GSS1_9CORY|nr:acyltransferase family protein [Corynebacterium pilosum]STD70884.1 hypothetical membrane protein [Corynebacterium pilosum]